MHHSNLVPEVETPSISNPAGYTGLVSQNEACLEQNYFKGRNIFFQGLLNEAFSVITI
jgi:hypothetical protein